MDREHINFFNLSDLAGTAQKHSLLSRIFFPQKIASCPERKYNDLLSVA